MTDPVFALEPDVPRNVRRALAAFRLLRPPRRLAHRARRGADFIWRPRRRAARRGAGLRAGGVLASADRRQLGGGRGPDGRRLESHQLTALLQISRATARCWGVWSAASVCWQARRPAAPLDPPQHPPSAENIAAHYDLGNEFYAYFLDDDLLYSSALFTDDQQDLTEPSGPRWRLCDQLALTPGDHLLEIGTGWGRWPSTPPAITAAGSPPPPFPGAAPLGYRAHGPRRAAGSRRSAALRLPRSARRVRQTGVDD